jgi:predicted secreted hydrolase
MKPHGNKMLRRRTGVLTAVFILALQCAGAGFEYREALPGYSYQFPRDHFEHEDFRTEWWYYTGNVTGKGGERFGFELVFFRQCQRGSGETENPSAWKIDDVYVAHAALTDVRGKQFRFDERVNRRGPGIAGASFADNRVWNGNWSAAWAGGKQTLDAVSDQFRFHLDLKPEKPFVIHGENGVSQKAEGRGRASHYVSFPRLAVSGTINSTAVTGQAWMDHEWFTEQLAPDQLGWDWFSVQLDDHTELMLFELRRRDGSIDPYSSGTFIDASSTARHLRRENFSLQPISYWHKYPIEWSVKVPSRKIDVTAKAVMPNQELKAKRGGPGYWEGAVDYKGTQTGVGYLEMTGYDGAVRF